MAKFEIFDGQARVFSTDHEPMLHTFLVNPRAFIPGLRQEFAAQFSQVLSALPEASSRRTSKDVPLEVCRGDVRLKIN